MEYRVSGDELAGPAGLTLHSCVEFLEQIQELIDIAHISCGSFLSDTEHIMHPTMFLPDGCNAHFAADIKACGRIHIPILTLGAFQQPALMEQIIKEGKADLIAMARGIIADPNMPVKAQTGRADEIIPCIRCMQCTDHSKPGLRTFGCSCNPTTGRELQLSRLIPPAGSPRRVVVVGGGPAGMQAAITARERGHGVILLEKEDRLGGKLQLSRQVPFKKDLCRYMDYLIHMTQKRGVDVRLRTEATPELTASLSPDVVIAAIGAVPVIPRLPGVHNTNVYTAEAVYSLIEKDIDLGGQIVVIGGGEIGCETALYLADALGTRVTVLEAQDAVIPDTPVLTRTALLEHMQEKVICRTGVRIQSIQDKAIAFSTSSGETSLIPASTVILSCGMQAQRKSAAAFLGTAPEAFTVGDCVLASNVRHAVRTAFDAASHI